MQCTGKELSSELSLEEKKEALKQAMAGKRVLLCLDDLWDEQHELELNFVDADAGSKVLVSTRIEAHLRAEWNEKLKAVEARVNTQLARKGKRMSEGSGEEQGAAKIQGNTAKQSEEGKESKAMGYQEGGSSSSKWRCISSRYVCSS